MTEPLKVIVAGGRDIENDQMVIYFMERGLSSLLFDRKDKTYEMVNGRCPTGVDRIAYEYGVAMGLTIWSFFPDWDQYGKRAGPIRNEQMAKAADALILIWDGLSTGSNNMKEHAIKYDLEIKEYILK